MNRAVGLLIGFLIVLSLGLAVNTVTQNLAQSRERTTRAEQKAPTTPAGECAVPAGAPATASTPLPPFEQVAVAQDTPRAKLLGDWVNAQFERRALTRITITAKPDGVAIQPWALHPVGEKPYGEPRKVTSAKNPFELTWEGGFADQKMRFALLDDGRLRVDSVILCRDQLGTRSAMTTDYLNKTTPATLASHRGTIVSRAAAMASGKAPGKATMPGGT